jgi:1,4-dihydroxy-2-naphthoate octaprenyltransferase
LIPFGIRTKSLDELGILGRRSFPDEDLTVQIAEKQKPSGWRLWWLAARPKTLPAAAAPVVLGAAMAFFDGAFQLLPGLATLLASLLLQIGANLANDVFDYYRGADAGERLGPVRVTTAGLASPRQVLLAMWIVFGCAGALGIYLLSISGWPVLLVGLFAIAAAIGYTGGPMPYGYLGMGDLFVFLFFGPIAVGGSYYVMAKSIPIGLLTVAILVVNNLRDIDTDRKANKYTLAVRLGAAATRRQYLACVAAAYTLVVLMWLAGMAPVWVLLVGFSVPKAVRMIQSVNTTEGRALNRVLAGTGQLDLGFAILLSAGFVISAWLGS